MNLKKRIKEDGLRYFETHTPDVDVHFQPVSPEMMTSSPVLEPVKKSHKPLIWSLSSLGSLAALGAVAFIVVSQLFRAGNGASSSALTNPETDASSSQSYSSMTSSSETSPTMYSGLDALNAVAYPEGTRTDQAIDSSLVNGVQSFAQKSSALLGNDPLTNLVYSPISAYYALSLLLEGTGGSTYDQIADLLSVTDLSSLRTNARALYENLYFSEVTSATDDTGKPLTIESKMANAAFFNHSLPVAYDYAQALADYYYAPAFTTNFDSEGKAGIAEWVNDHTDDFLDVHADDFDVDNFTPMMFFNTIFLQDIWQKAFEATNVQATFTETATLTTSTIDYMRKTADLPYTEEATYTAVMDDYRSGNYIVYMKPAEGVTTADLLANPHFIADVTEVKNAPMRSVNLRVPEGKTSSKTELRNTLETLGMTDAFDVSQADLTGINPETDIWVSGVTQEAAVSFSHYGTTGAAYTDIATSGATSEIEAPTPFALDKSFVYVIMSPADVPLFIGVTNTK